MIGARLGEACGAYVSHGGAVASLEQRGPLRLEVRNEVARVDAVGHVRCRALRALRERARPIVAGHHSASRDRSRRWRRGSGSGSRGCGGGGELAGGA